MAKLTVEQKSIVELFSDKKSNFLIPDYQRPYAWDDKECQTLWDDIFNFAFPDNDCDKFNENDEYYLGPIVTFKNENGKMEIIDGQQRLTTLMLLLRAFYDGFKNANDKKSVSTRTRIEKCIWKTDEYDEPNLDVLKIDSEVATDNDKEEFLAILRTGQLESSYKSQYAKNFQFFKNCIETLLHKYSPFYTLMPNRILNNCILLPIEAESQDTALRIFSTLNDRGLPLSDADIFKAQFYKFYAQKNKKDSFIKEWKHLEEICEKIFHPKTGTPMDELFTRYMYYERALQKNTSSTTEALRKFYENDGYSLLKKEQTFENLKILADFWNDVSNQDKERFSEKVLQRLFVLNYAPNGMWYYFTSVYFMHNKDDNNLLDDEKFCAFLNKITAFIWAYAITNPGVNALRSPVYKEMVNIVEGKNIDFSDYIFEKERLTTLLDTYLFSNIRPITKSMLAWWAFNNTNQELLPIELPLEIEHIFARNRQEIENSLENKQNLESLGNKSLLEKRINIRVSDYKFEAKKKYYIGFTTDKNQIKIGTKIFELIKLAKEKSDFTEMDIINRTKVILEGFISFLADNGLLK